MNLFQLAQNDPAALAALLADASTPAHVLSWGAECLGAKWTPDRWWPTIQALLRHRSVTVREGAIVGLCGNQTEPDEPMGAAPLGFYDGRDWPADVGAIRDEALAELERVAADVAEHAAIRELATSALAQLRTGEKYPEIEVVATHPGFLLVGCLADSQTPPPPSSTLPR